MILLISVVIFRFRLTGNLAKFYILILKSSRLFQTSMTFPLSPTFRNTIIDFLDHQRRGFCLTFDWVPSRIRRLYSSSVKVLGPYSYIRYSGLDIWSSLVCLLMRFADKCQTVKKLPIAWLTMWVVHKLNTMPPKLVPWLVATGTYVVWGYGKKEGSSI